jgi:hypothetical protein
MLLQKHNIAIYSNNRQSRNYTPVREEELSDDPVSISSAKEWVHSHPMQYILVEVSRWALGPSIRIQGLSTSLALLILLKYSQLNCHLTRTTNGVILKELSGKADTHKKFPVMEPSVQHASVNISKGCC